MIGLYCLNEHYDWPEELLKVKRGTRGLGKCLTQENKEDGCHGNVKASRSVCVCVGGGVKVSEMWNHTMEVLEQVT